MTVHQTRRASPARSKRLMPRRHERTDNYRRRKTSFEHRPSLGSDYERASDSRDRGQIMKKRVSRTASKAATRQKVVSTWEQDPGSGDQPTGGQLVQRPAANLSTGPLPTAIRNPPRAPAVKVYSPGTPEFRYWVAADALRRGSDYWGSLLAGVTWEVGARLPVDLDHGVD